MAWVESISGEEKAQRQHAAQREHTASGNTRHVEAKRSERERAAEGERRHSRSSGHPATGFSGRSDPFSTPPHQELETRRTGGQAVRDLEAETGRTGGRGGRYLRHQSGRRPGESVVDTRYLPPTRAGGDRENRWVRGSGPSAGGALPLTPGPEFEWLIYPASK